MMSGPVPTGVDQETALDWLRYSLGLGEVQVISLPVREVIEDRQGHAYTLAPESVDPARLAKPREGAVITPGAGSPREALAQVLTTLAERGAACVLVEDEANRKRDPKPSLDGLLKTAFVGEQVIHWAGLEGSAEDAVVAVHRGSHGYPTNAFVTSASAEELGLVDGADLGSGAAGRVVGSLMAVIVAAYDNETYIIWEPS
jgi:hypothetical protein